MSAITRFSLSHLRRHVASTDRAPSVFVRCSLRRGDGSSSPPQRTATRKATSSPLFEQLFYFSDVDVSEGELASCVLTLAAFDAGIFGPPMLVGAADFVLEGVWARPGHEVWRQWVPLADPSQRRKGPQGHLRVCVAVVAAGEAAPDHAGEAEGGDDDGPGEGGDAGFGDDDLMEGRSANVLDLITAGLGGGGGAGGEAPVPWGVRASVYSGTDLPRTDWAPGSHSRPFVTLSVGSTASSTRARRGPNPSWRTELGVTLPLPPSGAGAPPVRLTLSDRRLASSDVVISALRFTAADVRQHAAYFAVPRLYPLYGAPRGPEAAPHARAAAKLARRMNAGYVTGCEYRGSLMLSLAAGPEAELGGPKRRSLGPPANISPPVNLILLAEILAVDLVLPEEKGLGAEVAVEVSHGLATGRTRCWYDASPLRASGGDVFAPIGEKISPLNCPVAGPLSGPDAGSSSPDVFVSILHRRAGLSRRLAFGRVPSYLLLPAVETEHPEEMGEASTGAPASFQAWLPLSADALGHRKGSSTVRSARPQGAVLVRLQFNRRPGGVPYFAGVTDREEAEAAAAAEAKAVASATAAAAAATSRRDLEAGGGGGCGGGGDGDGSDDDGGDGGPAPAAPAPAPRGPRLFAPGGALGPAAEPTRLQPVASRPFRLSVCVYQARGLPVADSDGGADPFVVTRCGRAVSKTQTVGHTTDPAWFADVPLTIDVPVASIPDMLSFGASVHHAKHVDRARRAMLVAGREAAAKAAAAAARRRGGGGAAAAAAAIDGGGGMPGDVRSATAPEPGFGGGTLFPGPEAAAYLASLAESDETGGEGRSGGGEGGGSSDSEGTASEEEVGGGGGSGGGGGGGGGGGRGGGGGGAAAVVARRSRPKGRRRHGGGGGDGEAPDAPPSPGDGEPMPWAAPPLHLTVWDRDSRRAEPLAVATVPLSRLWGRSATVGSDAPLGQLARALPPKWYPLRAFVFAGARKNAPSLGSGGQILIAIAIEGPTDSVAAVLARDADARREAARPPPPASTYASGLGLLGSLLGRGGTAVGTDQNAAARSGSGGGTAARLRRFAASGPGDAAAAVKAIDLDASPAEVEIVALGARGCRHASGLPASGPCIEFELTGALPLQGGALVGRTRFSSRPSGEHPNFRGEKVVLRGAFPTDPAVAPGLTVRLRDRLGGGGAGLGSGTILGIACVSPLPGSSLQGPSAADVAAENDAWAFMRRPGADPDAPFRGGAAGGSKTPSMASGLSLLSGTSDGRGHKKGREQRAGDGGGGFDDEARLGGGAYGGGRRGQSGEEAAAAALFDPHGLGEPPPYLVGRGVCTTELEASLGAPPFITVIVRRAGSAARAERGGGVAAGGDGGTADVARVKFLLRRIPLAPASVPGRVTDKDAAEAGKFTRLDHLSADAPLEGMAARLNAPPERYTVRVYVLRGLALRPTQANGLASAYVVATCGGRALGSRTEAVANSVYPPLYRLFEFKTALPGPGGLLSLAVMSASGSALPGARDAHIGTTHIDLEDRLFSPAWVERASVTPPVERRPLSLRPHGPSQGRLELFVEILDAAASSHPPFAIAPPPVESVELRLVVWNARGMENKKRLTAQNDLFFKAVLQGTDRLGVPLLVEKTTDVHWFASGRAGAFNYRLVFRFELPLEHPRLKIAGWCKDVAGASDNVIGEAALNLAPLCGRLIRQLRTARAAGDKRDAAEVLHPAPDKLNGGREWVKLYFGAAAAASSSSSRKPKPKGEVEIEYRLMAAKRAEARPCGEGQDEPNRDPLCPKPDRLTLDFFNPLGNLALIIGPERLRQALALLISLGLILLVAYVTLTVGNDYVSAEIQRRLGVRGGAQAGAGAAAGGKGLGGGVGGLVGG